MDILNKLTPIKLLKMPPCNNVVFIVTNGCFGDVVGAVLMAG